MGNQQDADKKENQLLNLQKWPLYPNQHISSCSISGLFFQETSISHVHYRRFYADEEKIYFVEDQNIRYLPLYFTKMEEKLYFYNGERVYALKLIHNSFFTILSTFDRQNFIVFYCALAQYCILNDFQRHFQVKQLIGKGSYGTVYRGTNRLSNEEVALKVFEKNNLKQNTYCKKVVQNQIYVLKKLKKVNLSPLYEVFETSDCIVLVLQMAKQGDLLNFLLKQETVINDNLVKHTFQKILEGLQALHQSGFIHRDIKPQNIVIRHNCEHISLFICDFSISILKNDKNCSQMKKMQAGSKGYVAPQVLKNNHFSQKCDIFSFGCLAYLILSGKKLFQGIPNNQIIVLTQDNQFIEHELKKLNAPKCLKRLLKKLLQVDPQKRVSAKQALNDQYFSDKEEEKPCLVENDSTLKEFIQKRILKYECSTRGGTFF